MSAHDAMAGFRLFYGESSKTVVDSIERVVSMPLDSDGLPSIDREFSAAIARYHTPALLSGFGDSLAELEVGLAIDFEARYERALSRV